MYRFGIIQLKQPITKTFTLPETNIANAPENRHFAPKENESSEPTMNLQGKNVSFGEGICVYVPVVPHKAVAKVSRIGDYRRDWLL